MGVLVFGQVGGLVCGRAGVWAEWCGRAGARAGGWARRDADGRAGERTGCVDGRLGGLAGE